MNIDLQKILSLNSSQMLSFQKEDLNELRSDIVGMRGNIQKDLHKNKQTYENYENLKKSWLKLDLMKESLGIVTDEHETEKRLNIAKNMEDVLETIHIQQQNLQDITSLVNEIDVILLQVSLQ